MMGYDFSVLNDKEFEILACDLLSEIHGKRVMRYKAGKDRWVDGSFFSGNGGETIVQCKHYYKTGYTWMISTLKNQEVKKVRKLNPSKYIFVTSVSLSRENKKEIETIFSPYIENIRDVLGKEDLNDLLAKNPAIEEKHFKLWISSTNVFDRIINNAIKGRGISELKRIQKRSKYYVQTDDYENALKKLNSSHVLIISWEPGIGKTTLAENLCLHYASKGFEFIAIEEPFNEAEQVYKQWKKQVFYFDDFLWSNYIEAIENRKDSFIVKFIERIKADKNKRFILTTRTNILNAWIAHSTKLSEAKIQKNEFMLTIKDLTPIDRARILYNRIWHSNLDEDFCNEFYVDKRYRKVIRHKNFNPRLIEFITDHDRIENVDITGYWKYIEWTLANPKDVWRNCFNSQSDDFVRNLVTLTVFSGWIISERTLREWFDSLVEFEQPLNQWHTAKTFQALIPIAVKSFLNREVRWNIVLYSLFNPSISDFVHNEYQQDEKKLSRVFQALNSVSSLRTLETLPEEILSKGSVQSIKNSLFLEAIRAKKNPNYLICVGTYFIKDSTKRKDIVTTLQGVIDAPVRILEVSKFVSLIREFACDLDFKDFSFFQETVSSQDLDSTDINFILELLLSSKNTDTTTIDWIRDRTNDCLCEMLSEELNDLDLRGYYWECGFEKWRLEQDLISEGRSILDLQFSEKIKELNIDVISVVNQLDIAGALGNYLESLRDDYDEELEPRADSWDFEADIDFLFQKT